MGSVDVYMYVYCNHLTWQIVLHIYTHTSNYYYYYYYFNCLITLAAK